MADHVEILSTWLHGRSDEQIEFLKSLVNLETPSQDPESQKAIFQILKEKFIQMGYRNLYIPGSKTGGYQISIPDKRRRYQPVQLLIGHCDTVWPNGSLEKMPWKNKGEFIHGPGVYDMKAGISQIVFALQAISEAGLSPTVTPMVLINSDEEIGSRESRQAIERLARIADRALIMEPPLGLDGKLKTARKGIGRFTITIRGTAAHAGLDPGKGQCAIVELSHQIQQLFALNDHDNGITVNVGMIEGGISANVVAPESKAVVDVRVLSVDDGEMITKKILGLQSFNKDVSMEITGGIGRQPMEKTPRNRELWQLARDTGELLDLDLSEATAGGGSDGNTTSKYTATLDGLGTNGDGAHAHYEHIITRKLTERTLLLASLIMAPRLQSTKN